MLCVRGKKTQRVVAPLVLEAFVGPRPRGTECCHWDGDPTNDALSNLRWGTSKENSADQMRHGRHGMAIRTQCPRGHDLFPPNLAPNPRGVRQCRACACTYVWAHDRGIHRTDPRWIREADRQYARIMAEGPRGPKKDNVKKTACPRGHQLSEPNLVNQQGVRACLACGRTHSWARPRGIPFGDPRWLAEADRRYAEIMGESIERDVVRAGWSGPDRGANHRHGDALSGAGVVSELGDPAPSVVRSVASGADRD